jgi:DNA-3-methyladenine glycosylase I
MPYALLNHTDGHKRCSWCGEGPAFTDYIHYHDSEWGMPSSDDRVLYEKIVLEGFQAGLSWVTVLRKRERFREVFACFDFAKVARFTENDIARLVLDAGIIRHRGKIVSAINNAQRVCTLIDKEGPGALARRVWTHEPSAKARPTKMTAEAVSALTQTTESLALSKTLKKLGFSFVGPTTLYALMQAMGLVNDHIEGCAHRRLVDEARSAFLRP